MRRQPRNAKDGIFAGGMGFDVAFQGLIVTVLTVLAYIIGHHIETGNWTFTNSNDGMTMAFLTLSMVEIFHSFNMRSRRKSVFTIKNQNKFLWGAMILSLLLTTAVIYVPFLRSAFGFTEIDVQEYFIAMGLAFSIIPIMEIVKAIQRALKK